MEYCELYDMTVRPVCDINCLSTVIVTSDDGLSSNVWGTNYADILRKEIDTKLLSYSSR